MRESRSKPGMPVRRDDDDGRPISLMITRAGRDAIGVDVNEKQRKRFVLTRRPRRGRPCSSDQGTYCAAHLQRCLCTL
jgi:hypothetical protein